MTAAEREKPKYVWLDSQIVPYESAKIHALSTAFKYAAIVYEGLRGYWNQESGQLYIFRVADHLRRLDDSAKVARMTIPASRAEIEARIVELAQANQLRQDIHVRILVYVAADDGLLDSLTQWASSLPPSRWDGTRKRRQADRGLNVCVSHWRRNSDDGSPLRVKTTGNYFNSRLALLQARDGGYDDAIIVDSAGKVTEGPGYNIFLFRGGRLATPAVTHGILEGVTRDTIIHLTGKPAARTSRSGQSTNLSSTSLTSSSTAAAEKKSVLSAASMGLSCGRRHLVTSRNR